MDQNCFDESIFINLDVAKAFDKVWHKALISNEFKLQAGMPLGISKFIHFNTSKTQLFLFCNKRNVFPVFTAFGDDIISHAYSCGS